MVFSSSVESNLLEEFEQLAAEEKVARTELLQQAMKLLIESKKGIGLATPIANAYNSSEQPNTIQTSLNSFANLSRENIEEWTCVIEDHSMLSRFKTNCYTGSKAADKQSMVLYVKGIKA